MIFCAAYGCIEEHLPGNPFCAKHAKHRTAADVPPGQDPAFSPHKPFPKRYWAKRKGKGLMGGLDEAPAGDADC